MEVLSQLSMLLEAGSLS